MKKRISILFFLLLSLNSYSQFNFGISSGGTMVIVENYNTYMPTYCLNVSTIYYIDDNFMLDLRLSFLGKMKLNDYWIFEELNANTIYANSVNMQYKPIPSLSLKYILYAKKNLPNIIFGIGISRNTSRVDGQLSFSGGYSNNYLSFEGGNQSNFCTAPILGLNYNLNNHIILFSQFMYGIEFSEQRLHLLSLDVGFAYSISKTK